MKERLMNTCSFSKAWKETDETNHARSEVGYIRADYQGRWWNSVWPIHSELMTHELAKEFDGVYEDFCREFPNLDAVRELCETFAEPTGDQTEYNVYLEGKYGLYWLRLITRYRDYNLYLHCLSRAALEG